MFKPKYNRWSFTLVFAVTLLFVQVCLYVSAVLAQDEKKPYIGIRISRHLDPRVPIVDKQDFLGLHMDGLRSPLLQRRISGLRRDVEYHLHRALIRS